MDSPERQQLVLVSGAPGSGKTMLSVPLATCLSFTLIAKDDIKETMFAALGGRRGDIEESQRFGRAAIDVMWALARCAPRVVLDSNFRREFTVPRLERVDATIVEVHCACAPDELVQRIRTRASVRHAAHWDIEWLERFHDGQAVLDAHGPVGMGAVIEVDTTAPVDVDALAAEVARALDAEAGTP